MPTHKSEDYKLSAVEYYLIEDKTQKEVCKIFKCSARSLLRWVDKYNENGEIKRHNRKPVAYKVHKEHVKFLEYIPNPNQVHLFYNTNGTVRPTKNLIDLWSTFKLVQLDFSIDDIGERFEYQRYPAKWEEVKENLQWFIDVMPVNCMFGVNTAVGLLNQDTITELKYWLTENFKTNRVTDPIEHKQQPVTGLLSSNNTDWKDIVEYLDKLDQRRGTSWRRTFPELTQKIQAYNL